ncbi:hypothetical protein PROFUN_05757 [Planoprotostelium fungivorum]|uniref:Uncharacterized protein n=1 Tax=Planoprotostelium fungivorum TaxID=1890364 RepID=A0A2P6NPU8_9EUKA|nr:hypothetical protein PROFUN_05757 [Planoprotostelium fungivorum]
MGISSSSNPVDRNHQDTKVCQDAGGVGCCAKDIPCHEPNLQCTYLYEYNPENFQDLPRLLSLQRKSQTVGVDTAEMRPGASTVGGQEMCGNKNWDGCLTDVLVGTRIFGSQIDGYMSSHSQKNSHTELSKTPQKNDKSPPKENHSKSIDAAPVTSLTHNHTELRDIKAIGKTKKGVTSSREGSRSTTENFLMELDLASAESLNIPEDVVFLSHRSTLLIFFRSIDAALLQTESVQKLGSSVITHRSEN